MFRIRDLLLHLRPPWALPPREVGAGDTAGGAWGWRFFEALGIHADATNEAIRVALHAPWLRSPWSPSDALVDIGAERRMPRYPAETDAGYRARLAGAWVAYRYAGSAQAIIGQLEAFGLAQYPVSVTPFSGWGTVAGTLATGTTDPDGGTTAVSFTASATVTWHSVVTPYNGVEVRSVQRVRARFSYRTPTGVLPLLDVSVETAGGVVRCTSRIDAYAPVSVSSYSGFEFVLAEDAGGGWTDIVVEWLAQPGDRLRCAPSASGANWGNSTGIVVYFSGVTLETNTIAVISAIESSLEAAEEWWSRFWVIVPRGVHPYTSSVPTDDQTAIIGLIRKWKPAHWTCGGVVFLTSGFTWGYHEPLETWGDFDDAGVTWGDSAGLTVTQGDGF